MMRRPAWRGVSGVAALEFALCAPLLLVMLAGLSDLGLAMRSKTRLAGGVANAATYAVLTQGTATSATLAAIVQTASTLSGVQASATAAACFCPSGSPVSLAVASCGSTCANGATAGSYVNITASYNYTPLMPGYGFVANTKLAEATWVQVK
jgi:Flp pilus assembly protein TadG